MARVSLGITQFYLPVPPTHKPPAFTPQPQSITLWLVLAAATNGGMARLS